MKHRKWRSFDILFISAFLVALCFFSSVIAGPATALTLEASSAASTATGDVPFADFYAYDKNTPLNVVPELESETESYALYRVDFDSVRNARVPALLMVPKKGTPPRPCFLFGHGFMGNKSDIKSFLEIIAAKNMCVISIDAVMHGDRKVSDKMLYSKYLYGMRDGIAETVIDMRRALDYLQSRPDVDGRRLGYVGGSMGGILGAILAGVDDRVRAPVLIVGGGDWGYLVSKSVVAEAIGLKSAENRIPLSEIRRILAPVEPLNFVKNISPRPLLMLNAKHDILVNPYSNWLLFYKALSPKRIVWFDSDHEIPEKLALEELIPWLDLYLIGDKKPDFDTIVEGKNTKPMPRLRNLEFPQKRTGMSPEEYLQYDKNLPLEKEIKAEKEKETAVAKVYSVSFISTYNRKVTAELRIPKSGKAPYPVVILTKRTSVVTGDMYLSTYTEALTGKGIAVIIMNYEGKFSSDIYQFLSEPYRFRDLNTELIADIRRTVDLLETVPDVDSKRIRAFGEGVCFAPVVAGAKLDSRFQVITMIDPNGESADLFH